MGHGHVTPNADGSKARCGGPQFCSVCQGEAHFLERASNLPLLPKKGKGAKDQLSIAETNAILPPKSQDASNCFVEIDGGAAMRWPTKDEATGTAKLAKAIDDARARKAALQKEIEQLDQVIRACKHVVSYDIYGFMYTQRICYACGAQDLV